MKLLHTSDWHVGKAIRGASRSDEHRAVLDEVAAIAAADDVDVVVVAGDLFDTSTPSPESEEIVYRALLALAGTGATVAVIAGNHDNARRLRAVAPLLELGNVHLVTEPTRPDDGGVLALTTRDRTDVRIAMLPFVSKRGIVRAGRPDGRRGVRERPALQRSAAPADRGAVRGLPPGHRQRPRRPRLRARRRRRRRRATGAPRRRVRRHGAVVPRRPSATAPSATCTGRSASRPGRRCTTAGRRCSWTSARATNPSRSTSSRSSPACPPTSAPVRLTSGRPLRTVAGTLDELAEIAVDGDPWLRVVVRGPRRAGLADDVRRLLGPRVVDVRIDAPMPAPALGPATTTTAAARRSCSTSTSPARASSTTAVADAVRRAARRGADERREAAALGAGGLRRVPRRRAPSTSPTSSSWRSSAPPASGKSTIIDAITFALYGSVARYDDNRASSPR